MVRKTLEMLTAKIGGLREAAFWLSLFALLSQLLALARDRLLAHNFGAGTELDIYYASFKIPDLIFVTVASFVSISALVPLFAKKESEGEKHLHDATDSIFTVFSVLIVIACVLAWILMPMIIPIFFGNLPIVAQHQVVTLSRILLLSPLLLGFSNFFGSIVQYEKRFILYSLSPILYNIGILLGLVFGVDRYGILAVAMGVVFGAFLHLFLQASFIFFSSFRPHFTRHIKWSDVYETAYLSVPRTFALSIVTFVGFLFASFASTLDEGSIAVFNLSFNLQSVPLSLIGVSFSLAAFPALAVSFARRDDSEITERLSDGLRQIIFWSLPVTALLVILRAHIVRVVLGSGNFDWAATRLTAAVFALFVISTVFQSIQLFLSRSHYALGKTRSPLLANIIGGAVSIALALIFINFYGVFEEFFYLLASLLNIDDLSYKIITLPVAFSIGSLVTAFTLFLALGTAHRVEVWRNTCALSLHSFIAALFVGFASYITLRIFDGVFDLETFFGVLAHGAVAGLVGIAVGAIVLYLLRDREMEAILAKLR